jgi:hypothetical protein
VATSATRLLPDGRGGRERTGQADFVGMIVVAQGEIGIDNRLKSISCGLIGDLPPSPDRLIYGSKRSNGNQFVFGRKLL